MARKPNPELYARCSHPVDRATAEQRVKDFTDRVAEARESCLIADVVLILAVPTDEGRSLYSMSSLGDQRLSPQLAGMLFGYLREQEAQAAEQSLAEAIASGAASAGRPTHEDEAVGLLRELHETSRNLKAANDKDAAHALACALKVSRFLEQHDKAETEDDGA